MEITIKNVGLIANSTIKLDGLTVITGSNNSGKSTVGKIVYSCIEGLENLEEKRNLELAYYYNSIIREVQRIIKIENILGYLDMDSMTEEERYVIEDIFGKEKRYYVHVKNIFDIQKEVEDLIHGLEIFTVAFFEEHTKKSSNQFPKKYYAYLENFNASKEKALKVIGKIEAYFEDSNMLQYAAKSLLQTFSVEFNGQIFPLKLNQKEKFSHIEISQNGEIGSEFTICNNEEIIHYDKILNKQFYKRAIFIDNPRILDSMKRSHYWSRLEFPEDHTSKLSILLTMPEKDSIVEQTINEKAYANIIAKIEENVPGQLIYKDNNYYYADGPRKPLRVENLATGSKLFAIVATLLRRGCIGLDTVLIFDEPESHLHPEWQNIFAEIIVMLVRELDVNVLLTTHSTNMMLAIETYMRKYKLKDKTNFYITEPTEKNMIRYKLVNDDINLIYADFVKYFTAMKIERAKYLVEE